MVVCAACDQSNPGNARFCMPCGSALPLSARPLEERKVVTVLVCDLVGFTELFDHADPEDVKAALRP